VTGENQQQIEVVSVNFTLGTAEGPIQASATVPAGETNLTELLPVLQSLNDSILNGVQEQIGAAGLQVSCKAGCGACCRQLVPISIFEAEALGKWINTLAEDVQQELARRFDQSLRSLAKAGILERVLEEDWIQDKDLALDLSLTYFQAGIPCPFLEDDSCSIHPIRPMICREYLVTSPAAHCSNPTPETVNPIPLPLYLSRVLTNMGAEAEHETRGWIPFLFLFAWMEAKAEPGRYFSGEGPKVLYEFLRRIDRARMR